ncbi:methyltransferase domain-containing protein [Flaviflagellibacter deserti]|uniref:Methyltransferase domain-containing protein n=1 Tax=Flaviflagellibacter deserti TaxID=2267266 RepID=A0ABV9Z3W1_9HYPH
MPSSTDRRFCCKSCGSELRDVFLDLGEQPLANAFLVHADEDERRYPLTVRVCEECFLVQADHDIPADAIFTSDYVYFSSTSKSWVEHARRYAEVMIDRFGLTPGSRVVEVASNDGYLLQHFKAAGIPVLGVEPTANTAAVARERDIPTESAFFSAEVAADLRKRYGPADLMAANNVLAHVPDIVGFVRGFAELLAPDGVATFEFPHLMEMIESGKFDTVYHEHYSYLSLVAAESVFRRCGLRVFDLETLPTQGGSLRLYVCQDGSSWKETPAVEAFRARERALGMHEMAGYRGFEPRVQKIRDAFLGFLADAKSEGRTIAAYGAAAKGNTFLNFCGITASDIVAVADASSAKQGKFLPGSRIPVVTPTELAGLGPDYVLILPWNLASEIEAQLAYLAADGTRFVTAIPRLDIH